MQDNKDKTIRLEPIKEWVDVSFPDNKAAIMLKELNRIWEKYGYRETWDVIKKVNESPSPVQGITKEGWISVEDRLPEMNEEWSKFRVLAFDGSVMKVVSLYKNGRMGILGYNTQQSDYMNGITHWMPLPAPPGQSQTEQKLTSIEEQPGEITELKKQFKESLLLYQNMCNQITKDQQEIERLKGIMKVVFYATMPAASEDRILEEWGKFIERNNL